MIQQPEQQSVQNQPIIEYQVDNNNPSLYQNKEIFMFGDVEDIEAINQSVWA